MTHVEHRPSSHDGATRAAAAQMLARNDWRLLDADELARRVARSLERDPEAGAGAPEPEERPWRRRVAVGRPQAWEARPAEAAALRIYARALYAALAGQSGPDDQERAYLELHRYAARAAARCAPQLSRDERDELAAHAVAELYCRHLAGAPAEDPDGVAGAFIALTLQQVRNTVRLWRSRVGPWVPLGDGGDDGEGDAGGAPPDLAERSDPQALAERRELREAVAASFRRAVERYPRARLQLHAVWLHLVEEKRYGAIAAELGTSVEHARLLTWRGLRRLGDDPSFRLHAIDDELLAGSRGPADQEREHGHG